MTRRHALFTLVGIAGEDDLDAPDLCDGPDSSSARDSQSRGPSRMPGNGHAPGATTREPPVILDTDQSAVSRERLLAELGNIAFTDLAVTWVRRSLARTAPGRMIECRNQQASPQLRREQ
jgi:hypothetical protein